MARRGIRGMICHITQRYANYSSSYFLILTGPALDRYYLLTRLKHLRRSNLVASKISILMEAQAIIRPGISLASCRPQLVRQVLDLPQQRLKRALQPSSIDRI